MEQHQRNTLKPVTDMPTELECLTKADEMEALAVTCAGSDLAIKYTELAKSWHELAGRAHLQEKSASNDQELRDSNDKLVDGGSFYTFQLGSNHPEQTSED